MTEASIDPLAAWQACDIRVGTVVRAEAFTGGRYSTHVLWIDLGAELGTKKSLARLVPLYTPEELIGRAVLCLASLPPRQIGSHMSEVLTLGVPDSDGQTSLISPDHPVPPGGRLH